MSASTSTKEPFGASVLLLPLACPQIGITVEIARSRAETARKGPCICHLHQRPKSDCSERKPSRNAGEYPPPPLETVELICTLLEVAPHNFNYILGSRNPGACGCGCGSETLKHVGTMLILVQAAKVTLELPHNSFRPTDQIELFS